MKLCQRRFGLDIIKRVFTQSELDQGTEQDPQGGGHVTKPDMDN